MSIFAGGCSWGSTLKGREREGRKWVTRIGFQPTRSSIISNNNNNNNNPFPLHLGVVLFMVVTVQAVVMVARAGCGKSARTKNK